MNKKQSVFFSPQGFLTFMGLNANLEELNPFSHNYDIDFIQNFDAHAIFTAFMGDALRVELISMDTSKFMKILYVLSFKAYTLGLPLSRL
jgi:hypothetical protein